MLLLPLVLGAFVPAAEPCPPVQEPDLAHLSRLSSAAHRVRWRDSGVVDTESAEYPVESAANSSQVFVLPAGPRTVRALEVIPAPKTAAAWRQARLRLTWEDDNPDPSRAGFDLPLGLAFGRVWESNEVQSLVVAATGSAWVNRLPMPYRTRALLRIDTGAPLEGRIRVKTTRGADPDTGFLRAAEWTSPRNFAATGRGQLVGVIVVSGGPGPEQVGRLTVDGKSVGRLAPALGWVDRQSSTSDRFQENGWLPESLAPGAEAGERRVRSAIYAWRVSDPVEFRHSFSIEAGAGQGVKAGSDAASPGVSQTAAVFWYTEDPRPRRGAR